METASVPAELVHPTASSIDAPRTASTNAASSSTDSIPVDQIDSTFKSTCIDLISAPLGSIVLSHSDEFFAPASNLTNPSAPISRPGVFVPTGAWYDGWETRRHNPAPYDYVIIRLGVASGLVRGVEIDTAFFTGNFAPAVSVEGCYETGPKADDRVKDPGYDGWKEVLARRDCGPSRRHAWKVDVAASSRPVTHVRLRQYPDGGIARFRLYGVARPVWPEDASQEVELSSALMGGVAVAWSDAHYGTPANLLLPGRGKDMGDGWETARSRGAGHLDWAIVKLGARGTVSRIVVDTAFFRGNFPRAVKVEALDAGYKQLDERDVPTVADERWLEMLPEEKMKADQEFSFRDELAANTLGKPFTHFKLTMIPDGGVKRFRVFGRRM